jgi:hypothetical protein
MQGIRILWPSVYSSQGKHTRDSTPVVSDEDAAALIACGAAEAIKPPPAPATRRKAKASDED